MPAVVSPRSGLPPSGASHHELPVHEVVLLLGADPHRGLTAAEAARRLEQLGPNVLPEPARVPVVLRVLSQFHHPLIYVLLAAAAITGLLREYVDCAVILGVVLVNAAVGFVQESRAEAALESLRSMVRTTARVIRDGHEHRVPSEELVAGDLVVLEAGDKVPADLRLVRITDLQVDESALTGESVPVVKDEVVLPQATPVADRRNMAYSGTLVTAGTAAGVAVATGAQTELGEIHRLVGATKPLATPLTAKLTWFSKVLTVAILALAAVTFAVGLLRGQDAVQTFTAAIALAVGAIPEGLPAAVTISLAIGVARMARRRAVIRRLPAVETLGSTTVICSDKTGTLTENRMTVRAVWTPDGEYSVSGSGLEASGVVRDERERVVDVSASAGLRWCLLAGALCNDADAIRQDDRWALDGDPTEAAMLVAATKASLDLETIRRDHPRVRTLPFSSERQYMATLHEFPGGTDGVEHVLLLKGAAERLCRLCGGQLDAGGQVRPLDTDAVLAAVSDLAGRGLRVLATAVQTDADPVAWDDPVARDVDPKPRTAVLAGLQAMIDPPRAAASTAVDACHTAGISVKMITGDHAVTAAAVGRQVGLPAGHRGADVLTGAELQALAGEDYIDAVDRATVFARVTPEQKLQLVQALQARGHVVAMTGDGVNDAPALRQADIGVAMGRGGTEVAKDAADMVLTDDDFATIEAAVEEGRGVFDNLTKFIVWTLPTNMGEGLVILVAILLGMALPILPTQILWINMTTAVALGLMLAFEPKEPGIMARPPREPSRPLLTRALVARTLLVSALLVAGSWWLFTWELARGASVDEARTAAVNLFVVVEAFYLFSCRALTHSPLSLGLFGNRWLLVGVTVQAFAQLAITYLPVMNRVFQTAPLDLDVWLRILGLAALTSLVVSVEKWLRRKQRW
jgi:cation-transporting ATPase F